jgi:hypothetical protein
MSNPDSWYDPPEERFAKCQCGHSEEDHNDEDDLEREVMLESLRRIDDLINNSRPLETTKAAYPIIRKILDEALSVCPECDCRGFVESDDDDFDEDIGTERQ